MKVNIYNRDRKGGHQPSTFSSLAGVCADTPEGRKFSKKVHVRALRRESKRFTEQALKWWHMEQEQEAQELEAEISAASSDFWDFDSRPGDELEPEYPTRYVYDEYPDYYDFSVHDYERELGPKPDWELGYEQGYRHASRSKPDTVQVCLHKWHKVQQLTGFDSQTLLNYFTSSGIKVELT